MNPDRIFTVTLAAGRGVRIGSGDIAKVCRKVGGVAFILHVLDAYEEAGITNHVVVVGAHGDQVLYTVGERFPNATFAFQPEPFGTGHATQCGVRGLRAAGFEGDVLVSMGDRLLAPHAIRKLLDTFAQTDNDITLLVGQVRDNPSSGQIVYDTAGRAVAIVEKSDIALSALIREIEAPVRDGDTLASADILGRIRTCFPREEKAAAACGELYARLTSTEEISAAEIRRLVRPLRERTTVTVWEAGRPHQVAGADVESAAEHANLACYLFRSSVLFDGLGKLRRDNAQGEEYLTDIVRDAAAEHDSEGRPLRRITTVCIDNPDDALTFNTPEELADVERRLRIRNIQQVRLVERPQLLHENSLRSVADWHMLFSMNARPVRSFMADTYGQNVELHERKRRAYLRALECYAQNYAMHDMVFIVRSPGRLNLMGRHIDHRGGFTNVVAIDEEVLLVCCSRKDDTIQLLNTNDALFGECAFSISEQIAALDWGDWRKVIGSAKTLALVSNGHWENYFKAAVLRLQVEFRDISLLGATICTHGTIPIGSGLSSSSAVVVAASEALVAANSLPVHANLQVDLCGEGEWFVGTRGGSGDHAAIKFGRRGQVVRLNFLPFELGPALPFGPDHCVVVCNSGRQAEKSGGARGVFNSKVLGYIIGEVLFKLLHPQYARRIERLRDINTDNLGVSEAELYRLLRAVPERISWEELYATYGPFGENDRDRLEAVRATLNGWDGAFEVRGVMLFGLAECERSRLCTDYLADGDVDGLGQLWFVSHDGDRVVSHDSDMREVPWQYAVDDAYMSWLIETAESSDPRVSGRAALALQPGSYSCSTPEIDLIVDAARVVPGVKGAQMAGAGLGGCVMILVESGATANLIRRLGEFGFSASRFEFVEGAGLVVI